jgi:hypothetical protein
LKLISAIATSTVLTFGAQAAEAATYDTGGQLYGYIIDYMKIKRSGRPYPLKYCASACTLYLTLPNACLLPGAKFGFHSASTSIGTTWILGIYPDWVHSWLRSNGGLTHIMKWMPYSYAVKHMRKCK